MAINLKSVVAFETTKVKTVVELAKSKEEGKRAEEYYIFSNMNSISPGRLSQATSLRNEGSSGDE